LSALDSLFDFDLQPVFLTASIPCYINSDIMCLSEVKSYSAAAICLNAMGNTNAGIVVSHALRDLNPSYVFMFGIAGGFKEEVGLEDVIIPDKIFYNALGKQLSDGTETRALRTDAVLLARLYSHVFHSRLTKSTKS
jgi:nucleoside phosphorylase